MPALPVRPASDAGPPARGNDAIAIARAADDNAVLKASNARSEDEPRHRALRPGRPGATPPPSAKPIRALRAGREPAARPGMRPPVLRA